MTDLMARLGLPVVVVARSTLGTINHTLLTIEALRRRSLAIAGVVHGRRPPNADNREAIEQLRRRPRCVGEMPLLRAADAGPALARGRRPSSTATAACWSLGDDAVSLVDRDRALVWHPYTQMKTAPPPLPIVRGEGVYLYTEDGRRLLDGISSWWVNIHGHSHPRLNQALAEQAQRLEHVIFAGARTSRPSIWPSGSSASLPAGLTRVFYSDNGSTAVEVAVKLARAVLAATRASRRDSGSSRCTTRITATPSARCR